MLPSRLISSLILYMVKEDYARAFLHFRKTDEKKEKTENWAKKLYLAFERKLDRPTGFQIAPKYVSVTEIQARLGLKEDEILDAVNYDDHFRLINVSVTQPADEHPQDKLAVELYQLNTPYGQCIDRGSKITIFSPSNTVDPIMGWWSYYVALIGGFNYISKELGVTRPYQSFYTYSPEKNYLHNQEFMDDMNRLVNSTDSWVFSLLSSSGSQEPTHPTQFHFAYGAKKGDETYDDPNITLNDVKSFDALYQEFAQLLETKYGLLSDRHRYHGNAAKSYFARHLDTKVNAVALLCRSNEFRHFTTRILSHLLHKGIAFGVNSCIIQRILCFGDAQETRTLLISLCSEAWHFKQFATRSEGAVFRTVIHNVLCQRGTKP